MKLDIGDSIRFITSPHTWVITQVTYRNGFPLSVIASHEDTQMVASYHYFEGIV